MPYLKRDFNSITYSITVTTFIICFHHWKHCFVEVSKKKKNKYKSVYLLYLVWKEYINLNRMAFLKASSSLGSEVRAY